MLSKHKISRFSVVLKETHFSGVLVGGSGDLERVISKLLRGGGRVPGMCCLARAGVVLEVPSMFSHLVGRCGTALGCLQAEDFIVVTLVSYLNLDVPALPWCKQSNSVCHP